MTIPKANPSSETLVFTCSGGSHPGQVANRAGVVLAEQGVGTLYCVAAVAAWIPDKLERARAARCVVAIDGCDDRCCRRVLESRGVPVSQHAIATALGVERTPLRPALTEDANRVAEQVRRFLAGA